MSRLPWIVGLGGGVAALYYWSRNTSSSTPAAQSTAPVQTVGKLEGQWIWPVPTWQGRRPVISDGFYSPRAGYPLHGGADIMFVRLPSDAFKAGTPNATKGFVMPDGMNALAASDGVVNSANKTPQGFAIVIDHGTRGVPELVSTFYTHLERLLVQAGDRVSVGQPIGVIGYSPLDAEKIKHLHFELRLGGATGRIDPAPVMRAWPVQPATSQPSTLVARNASLTYRTLGARGESYPQWVRDLKGRSGVYLIRDAQSHELLYVGSSSRRLYDTLTRHFQVWRRYKSFWSGQYSEGHDPGLTYDRSRVEVAIRFTGPDDSLDEESRLIERMSPRDNLIGQRIDTTDEEVPF